MAESFSEFFKENVGKVEEVEVKVSSRLPIFRIKAISEEEGGYIRGAATIKKSGKAEFDENKYSYLLCAACVTYPNFNNAELQDNYGVKNSTDLIKKMLTAGEFATLTAAVVEQNGFNEKFEDLKDEVKN